MATGALRLEQDERGEVTLHLGENATYHNVRIRRASPLSDPDHYIVFLDGDGRELCIVPNPLQLTPEAQLIVKEVLDGHYLSSQVTRVLSLRIEAEACYVAVETSRGRREFAIENLQEGVRRLGDQKLLFVDVDGNRFEVARLDQLDRRSAALLRKVL